LRKKEFVNLKKKEEKKENAMGLAGFGEGTGTTNS
jgi:hypothetical protein